MNTYIIIGICTISYIVLCTMIYLLAKANILLITYIKNLDKISNLIMDANKLSQQNERLALKYIKTNPENNKEINRIMIRRASLQEQHECVTTKIKSSIEVNRSLYHDILPMIYRKTGSDGN